MIQIALIAGTYQPQSCGVAHYTARLRDVLSEDGIKSTVLTTYAAVLATDTSVQGVVKNWRFSDLVNLVQAVHASGADILHIQHAAGTYGFERAIFLLPLLLKITKWHGKIVTTVHEYGWWEWQPRRVPPQLIEWLKMFGQRRHWWDREDGFLLTLSDAIVTTNAEAEAAIHTRLSALTDRLYSIPIAANVEVATTNREMARQILHEWNWPTDAVVIVFFGFLHPVKGLETLLPAFKQVLATQPRSRLLLVGGVESLALRGEYAKRYWDKLHALVAELDLTETVHLTGYVSAETASQYLTAADIGVLPFNHGITLKSGSLLALLAHGLPVVATQHTMSLPEGHPVQLIPARDVNALVTTLQELLNDLSKCADLGDAGRVFIEDFNWAKIGRSHLDIYQKVLNVDPTSS